MRDGTAKEERPEDMPRRSWVLNSSRFRGRAFLDKRFDRTPEAVDLGVLVEVSHLDVGERDYAGKRLARERQREPETLREPVRVTESARVRDGQ